MSNQVFRVEWEAHIPAIVGHVKVLRTWGAHPKALDEVDWSWLEGKMASPDCVAIGECGLDETAPNMAHQEDAFKRQIEKARQLKKPLMLHLRGRNPSRTSTIYGGVQAVASGLPQPAGGMFLADGFGHELLADAEDDAHRIASLGD